MKVAIAGGTGFLGQNLANRLRSAGFDVLTITRRPSTSSSMVTWQPDGSPGDLPQHLNGLDAVVNLAGENLAGGGKGSRLPFWTASRKAALRSSRVLSTRTIARAITQCANPPHVLVNASAVGYYGTLGDEPITEDAPAGSDFLARLCVEWEQEARVIEGSPTRLAIIRSGLVLAKEGGALPKMLLPFKLGAGATLGSGRQYMPWIHVDDWTALVMWMIANNAAAGAFNGSAPEPVTNHDFTRTLARVLRRPAVFRAPAFALRAAMGEMSHLLLTGQRAIPAAAERLGFQFTYRALEPALRSLHL